MKQGCDVHEGIELENLRTESRARTNQVDHPYSRESRALKVSLALPLAPFVITSKYMIAPSSGGLSEILDGACASFFFLTLFHEKNIALR